MSESKGSDELVSLLATTRVSALINKRFDSPIVLQSNMSVAQAAATLADAGISSAPVIAAHDQSIHYMFDFRDVCSLMVQYLEGDPDNRENRLKALDKGSQYSALIADVTIDQAKFISKDHGFQCIGSQDYMSLACVAFAKGVHRLAVIDAEGNFEGVISQSDVIKFIHEHVEQCKRTLQKTLVQLNLAKKRTVCISWEQTVLSGLSLMVKEGLSSIGLLDEADLLVGVLSMTDAKYIFHLKAFHLLKGSLCDFVSEVRQVSEASDGKTKYPVFSVRPQTTMETVVQKLVATRSHRIYVTENMAPVGVVSLTDIIRALTQ